MPYEILNFVILNANIKESSLGLNATNFDLEIDLHQSINIHIYIYIYIVNGNMWSVAMLDSEQILWDLNTVFM